MTKVDQFIGRQQLRTIRSLQRGEEGQFFTAKLAEIRATIDAMPKVYEQDGKGEEAIAHLHYFTSGGDWYITEKDSEPEQLQAFGLADLFGDGGEMGYISIEELTAHGAELDLHWRPKTLREIRAKR